MPHNPRQGNGLTDGLRCVSAAPGQRREKSHHAARLSRRALPGKGLPADQETLKK
jgi:hypothetical protein